MFKIKIYTIGKTKESWIQEAIEEYQKRLKPMMEIHFLLAKNDDELTALAEKERHLIGLDPKGTLYESEAFSTFLYEQLQVGKSRLAFVIGGADGIPPLLLKKCLLLSLSPLTFTHQMTRVILLEQLYRATQIRHNTKYHRADNRK